MPARHDGTSDEGYYYNLETGQVEHGKVSDWTSRIGPYPSEAEAAQALERVRARNEAWEEAERRWRDEDDPDED
ncbi:SPOR domain-containing protein [Ruania suaedae]|uniref:SPOR domain-containing protein n=1 Tax=Ruania suaedae TaxID=2897774 RepID=UPI001E460870|nr:SPOR domain-containing protein [Ruania suaedae]UFU01674.1 SPOR domain-containing protein [Ruania suaedae]